MHQLRVQYANCQWTIVSHCIARYVPDGDKVHARAVVEEGARGDDGGGAVALVRRRVGRRGDAVYQFEDSRCGRGNAAAATSVAPAVPPGEQPKPESPANSPGWGLSLIHI